MRVLGLWTATIIALVASGSALAKECPGNSPDCLQLYERWDINGFYHVVGETLTAKSGNIAQDLLKKSTVTVSQNPDTFPANASLVAVYLYWTGSRETPDTAVNFQAPGMPTPQPVNADKCYVDGDNRTGSISKNFYNCRANVINLFTPDVNH
ncbi:MAG TPA: hypothetical protein EYN66_10440, partial [Myxococcales bacterium]|nr:hypothetical protein [Myxococcales bacterium]